MKIQVMGTCNSKTSTNNKKTNSKTQNSIYSTYFLIQAQLQALAIEK